MLKQNAVTEGCYVAGDFVIFVGLVFGYQLDQGLDGIFHRLVIFKIYFQYVAVAGRVGRNEIEKQVKIWLTFGHLECGKR